MRPHETVLAYLSQKETNSKWLDKFTNVGPAIGPQTKDKEGPNVHGISYPFSTVDINAVDPDVIYQI